MPVRKAQATWEGKLRDGKGTMALGSGKLNVPFSFHTRFENEPGTNPEELAGAALAGCFSMAFGADLERAGYTATRIDTTADVHLETTDAGPRVTRIHLTMKATVPDIGADEFQKVANGTKKGCPISNLLTGAEITLDAALA